MEYYFPKYVSIIKNCGPFSAVTETVTWSRVSALTPLNIITCTNLQDQYTILLGNGDFICKEKVLAASQSVWEIFLWIMLIIIKIRICFHYLITIIYEIHIYIYHQFLYILFGREVSYHTNIQCTWERFRWHYRVAIALYLILSCV